jgi:hypothetical protein
MENRPSRDSGKTTKEDKEGGCVWFTHLARVKCRGVARAVQSLVDGLAVGGLRHHYVSMTLYALAPRRVWSFAVGGLRQHYVIA